MIHKSCSALLTIYDDVKILETIGLIEKNTDGLFLVPWDEIETTIRFAA